MTTVNEVMYRVVPVLGYRCEKSWLLQRKVEYLWGLFHRWVTIGEYYMAHAAEEGLEHVCKPAMYREGKEVS